MHDIACMTLHVCVRRSENRRQLPHIKASQSPPATCQSYDSDRRLKAMVSDSRKLICDALFIIQSTNTHTATIMSTKPGRLKSTPSSIIHPGKLCGPCCLCRKSQSTYTHLPNMQEELVRCLLAIQHVGHTDCICRCCAEDLCKHSHSSEYVPVRKGGRRTSKVATQCYVINCIESDTISSNAASPDTVYRVIVGARN